MRSIKRLMSIALVVAGAALVSACGQKVEVPPAHIGKIMTKDGYQENIIPASKFRLAKCWTYCDRLVVIDIADKTYQEQLNIFIPEDKLNLGVTVRATLSINPKKSAELFKMISPKEIDSQFSIIESQNIYQTYASQVIQKEVREMLSKYSISEIASSNEKINSDLAVKLNEVLGERTPYVVRFVGMTGLAYPKIITDAQEAAAERREAVQKEEAQLAISKAQLERELQEARLQRAIETEKAETEAAAQRTLATSVDDRVLKLRTLEIQMKLAEAQATAAGRWNGKQPDSVTILGGADKPLPMIFNLPNTAAAAK